MAIIYGLKVNLSVAIVAMVNQTAIKGTGSDHHKVEATGTGNDSMVCAVAETAEGEDSSVSISIFLWLAYSQTIRFIFQTFKHLKAMNVIINQQNDIFQTFNVKYESNNSKVNFAETFFFENFFERMIDWLRGGVSSSGHKSFWPLHEFYP